MNALRSALDGLRPADAGLIVAALALLGVLYLQLWQPPVAADWVEVRRGGELIGRFPLNVPRELPLRGHDGTVVIRIADGRVRFLTSSCRNQICVHSGWQTHRGDAAACLPNRISLRLGGAVHTADDIDAVAY